MKKQNFVEKQSFQDCLLSKGLEMFYWFLEKNYDFSFAGF